nr:protein ALP1-like isoform X5 [Bactrocera oleae]
MEIHLIVDEMGKSEEHFLLNYEKKRRIARKKRNLLLESILEKRRVTKVHHFFNTIEQYDNDVFFSHFRMTPHTFAKLTHALQPHWLTFNTRYSLKQSLYLTLWKLSNSRVTYRELSDRFCVGKGTAHKLFFMTIKTICQLKNEILWPTLVEQQKIMEEFQSKRTNPFPFVVGCMDGIHFKINTPKKDAISYYDRKGNFSITMQAICDSNLRFLDVFIGFPGSCHDANVWKNSPIYQQITSGEAQLATTAVILADSAYPLSKYLMVPYRDNGHLSPEEKKFNYYLSSTRVLVEQSFGLLRQKFRILNHIDVSTIKSASKIVMACTILHNFILSHSSDATSDDDNFYQYNNDTVAVDENINESSEGIIKRNELKMLFSS